MTLIYMDSVKSVGGKIDKSEGKILMWLPQYSVRNSKLYLFNDIDTQILIPANLEAMILKSRFFPRESIKNEVGDMLLAKLLNEGAFVEYMKIYEPVEKERTKDVLVIQPHSDDMALSCGGSVAKYKFSMGYNIRIVTVFTKHTVKCFYWRDKVKIDDVHYSNLRKIEDRMAADFLDAELIELEYSDAMLRNRLPDPIIKEGILKKDESLIEDITEKLIKIIENVKDGLVLIPAAIGWHYDHRIVYIAALNALKIACFSGQVLFYEDYPYCDESRSVYWRRLKEIQEHIVTTPIYNDVNKYLKQKATLINFYKSQLKGARMQEIITTINELAISTVIEAEFQGHEITGNTALAERMWKFECFI